jgi:hypothetical protein
LNANRLTRRIARTTLLLYAVTCVHHVIEGLGWVFDFRLKSLITPLTFGVPLLMTVALLRLYKATGHRFVLAVVATVTGLWWIVGIGLFDGFYNHTLNLVLSAAHAPSGLLKAIYPSYLPPPPGGPVRMACDGVKFSYCTLTPATVAFEVAGIASAILACVLAIDVYRLIRHRPAANETPHRKLPRRVLVGVSLGMLCAFGVAPTLGMYMTGGKPAALGLALAFMAAGLAAVALAPRAAVPPALEPATAPARTS